MKYQEKIVQKGFLKLNPSFIYNLVFENCIIDDFSPVYASLIEQLQRAQTTAFFKLRHEGEKKIGENILNV